MTRRLVILGTTVTVPDPASATDLAAGFREQGGHLADLEATLQTLTRPDAWGDWTGLAADAFGQSIGQLPAEIGDVRDAYDDVASALQRYAGQLEPVVNSLTALSFQAEDAEGTLTAVRTARSQAIARGQDPVTTGWDARLEDANAAVSALRGQLNRLIGEVTALAGTCARQVAAAEPKAARKSLFGEAESDFVRDVADPLAHAAAKSVKVVASVGDDAWHLVDETFVQPFTKLWTDLDAFINDPDLHTAGELLERVGDAVGVIALVVGVVALTVATGGTADVLLGVAGGLGDVAMGVHIDALGANTAAVLSHEDDASWSEVSVSALDVVSDYAGGKIGDDDPAAGDVFGVGSGLEITAFGDGLTHDLSIPPAAPDAPDVVSGLQVTTDAVQGLQGLPVTPAVQPAGEAGVLQPAVSVPSPAVVNIQQVTISPQPSGAVGSGQEGDM
jgi:uncharacterized protein YukE